MEATWDWYWVYDLLEGAGLEISLVHPLKAKAIASARIRSDRLDSRILAHLLRSYLLPCAYSKRSPWPARRSTLNRSRTSKRGCWCPFQASATTPPC